MGIILSIIARRALVYAQDALARTQINVWRPMIIMVMSLHNLEKSLDVMIKSMETKLKKLA